MAKSVFPGELTLLHNPRCSKSRGAKTLLEARDIEFQERLYLDDPLTRDELQELARRLGRPARDWVRRGEAAYKEAKLNADTSDDAILEAMAGSPTLIERPILIAKDRAIVGRPPERVLELVG